MRPCGVLDVAIHAMHALRTLGAPPHPMLSRWATACTHPHLTTGAGLGMGRDECETCCIPVASEPSCMRPCVPSAAAWVWMHAVCLHQCGECADVFRAAAAASACVEARAAESSSGECTVSWHVERGAACAGASRYPSAGVLGLGCRMSHLASHRLCGLSCRVGRGAVLLLVWALWRCRSTVTLIWRGKDYATCSTLLHSG